MSSPAPSFYANVLNSYSYVTIPGISTLSDAVKPAVSEKLEYKT